MRTRDQLQRKVAEYASRTSGAAVGFFAKPIRDLSETALWTLFIAGILGMITIGVPVIAGILAYAKYGILAAALSTIAAAVVAPIAIGLVAAVVSIAAPLFALYQLVVSPFKGLIRGWKLGISSFTDGRFFSADQAVPADLQANAGPSSQQFARMFRWGYAFANPAGRPVPTEQEITNAFQAFVQNLRTNATSQSPGVESSTSAATTTAASSATRNRPATSSATSASVVNGTSPATVAGSISNLSSGTNAARRNQSAASSAVTAATTDSGTTSSTATATRPSGSFLNKTPPAIVAGSTNKPQRDTRSDASTSRPMQRVASPSSVVTSTPVNSATEKRPVTPVTADSPVQDTPVGTETNGGITLHSMADFEAFTSLPVQRVANSSPAVTTTASSSATENRSATPVTVDSPVRDTVLDTEPDSTSRLPSIAANSNSFLAAPTQTQRAMDDATLPLAAGDSPQNSPR